MPKVDFRPDPKKVDAIRREKTLILIKPDAVTRKIVGEVIDRFERKSLKIVALKLVHPTKTMVEQHYIDSEEWLTEAGTKTYNNFIEKGFEVDKTPREIGLLIRKRLMSSMTAGPVVAMVVEGAHVVEAARKMRGATSPTHATPGTIGFDYSVDSYELGDAGDWGTKNIIHASDSVENAKREIGIWFKPNEIIEYDSAECQVLYSKDWYKS